MNETRERQPRERAVECRAGHDRRHPVETWNVSGLCDRHELELAGEPAKRRGPDYVQRAWERDHR